MFINHIDEIWTADLVDVSSLSKQNKGYKFLLTVIDVFSKYGWIIPLKNKSGETVAEAFKKILQQGRSPEKLWTDKGKEFYNQHVKALFKDPKSGDSLIYSTQNEEKSSIIERWNRTMQEKMYKYFTANETTNYTNILDDLVYQYNNKFHSSIKMSPIEASKKINEKQVQENLYSFSSAIHPKRKPKFELQDRVRITKKKKFFEKGYTPNWTRELFVISEIHYTDPITYKIIDLDGEDIIGSFYEPELQKSKF